MIHITESGEPIEAFADTIEARASDSALAAAVAAVAAELVADTFESSRDPDGRPWAPLKRPRAGGPVLVRTRALRDAATSAQVSGAEVELVSTAYGGFHQGGTKRMPARPFFPGDSLPTTWEQAIGRALDRALTGDA